MLLDIIIPHYNESWDICKPLIDMIHAQKCVKFDKFHVWIIHDGVPMFSKELIEGPANIFQVSIPQGGVSVARNFGMDQARILDNAEWIMFCDCDDCFTSIYSLATVFYLMGSEAANNFDLLWGSFYESGDIFEERKPIMEFSPVFIHNKYYRMSFLTDHQIRFPEGIRMSEDSAFNAIVKMELKPNRIGQINSAVPLYSWCRRSDSVTMDNSKWLWNTEGHFDRNLYILEEYKKRGYSLDNMIVRTITDAYAMLNRGGVPEPSEEFIKRVSEFFQEHKEEYNRVSKENRDVILAASNKNLGLKLNEEYPLEKWIDEKLKGERALSDKGVIDMENRCIICGAIIPEGRQVCPNCEAGQKPERKFALDEPIGPIIVDHGISLILCCRRCKKELKDHTDICPSCGQAIKWA